MVLYTQLNIQCFCQSSTDFTFKGITQLNLHPFPIKSPTLTRFAHSASSLKLTASPLTGKEGNPDKLIEENRAG